MVDEDTSAHDERLTEEAAVVDGADSGKDPVNEVIEILKALPVDTIQVVVSDVLQELPHQDAKKKVATSVVETLPDDAVEAKKEVAASAVHNLPEGAADAKTEIAKEAMYALPDDAAEHKKEIAALAVEALPDSAVTAKTEIATKVVGSLPDDATEEKKKVVQESVRNLSPEFRDYLIADLVTMRRLFRRVFVWTSFGASAVAIVIAILTAIGATFWDSEQVQNLLRVVIPVATLLLGYSFGRTYSEQADIKHLREQNPERRDGP